MGKKTVLWISAVFVIIIAMSIFTHVYEGKHPVVEREEAKYDPASSARRDADSLERIIKREEYVRKAQEEARYRDSINRLRALEQSYVESNPYDDGYDDGHEEGYDEGYEEGYEEGLKRGKEE